jgi:hypothetical protein
MAACFFRVADGTEDSIEYTASGEFGAAFCFGGGQIFSFTGSGTGGVVGASGNTGSGTDTSAEMPSVTTTAANSLAVALVGANGTGIADATGESGGDWAMPVATQTVNAGLVALQTANMTSIGTISGGSATVTSANLWDVMTFEIKELVLGAAPPPRSPLQHLHHLLIR